MRSLNARFTTDFEHILAHTPGLWEDLRDQRLFITGGTGFFGRWLLESFAWANQQLGLHAELVVLSRNPAAFLTKAPELAADTSIHWLAGRAQDFEFPPGVFTHVIHAATESAEGTGPQHHQCLFDDNVAATRRVLEFAEARHAHRLLFTSSGAVYGRQPSEITHLAEDFSGAPDPLDPTTCYGQAKRHSEYLCALAAERGRLQVTIARCFAFVGPHLRLDANFAIGNFTRDALAGGPIRVSGDGTPFRSYLYAADLMIWLWTILLRGLTGRAYNVGSDADLTIAQLAQLVSEVVNPAAKVIVSQATDSASPPQRYVPSIQRARTELGLAPWVDTREGIRRMAEWHRNLST